MGLKYFDLFLALCCSTRKIHEAGTSEKIGSVNEKLQVATSTLQQAIVGVSQSLASNNEKVKYDYSALDHCRNQRTCKLANPSNPLDSIRILSVRKGYTDLS